MAGLVIVLSLVGCGSSNTSAPPITSAAPTTSAESSTTAGGALSKAATTTTKAATTTTAGPIVPPYPREVQVSAITDARIRSWASPAATVIEIGPGVYAARGQGAISSDVRDYGGVFGLCTDVKPWQTKYSLGGTCW